MLTQQDVVALEADLAQFSGTDNWWKHRTGRLTYTDGVKFLAEKAGAFWLIDLVASYQTARLRQEEFHYPEPLNYVHQRRRHPRFLGESGVRSPHSYSVLRNRSRLSDALNRTDFVGMALSFATPFFHLHVGLDIMMGRRRALVSKPQSDDRYV